MTINALDDVSIIAFYIYNVSMYATFFVAFLPIIAVFAAGRLFPMPRETRVMHHSSLHLGSLVQCGPI